MIPDLRPTERLTIAIAISVTRGHLRVRTRRHPYERPTADGLRLAADQFADLHPMNREAIHHSINATATWLPLWCGRGHGKDQRASLGTDQPRADLVYTGGLLHMAA